MKNHKTSLRALLMAGTFLTGMQFLTAGSAMAGFQWVAPSDASQPGAASTQVITPPPSVQSIQPLPLQPGSAFQDFPAPTVIEGSRSMAVPPQTGPVIGIDQPSPYPAASEKLVEGFAKNIPLSVALRQILPAEYAFSLAPEVDPSTSVSWQGGAPWRLVLQTMLGDAGLAMREQNGGIIVGRASVFTPPVVEAAPMPAVGMPPSSTAFSAPSAMPQPIVVAQEPQPDVIMPIVDNWRADAGQNLRNILESWCQKAGVQLVWQAEYDYPLQASYLTTSSFEDAVRNLLLGFQEAQPQPYASLHNNPTLGQAVLVVEARGNNYSD